MNPNIRKSPKPNKEYTLTYPALTGGINLYDSEQDLQPNETPAMENLLWKNGMLRSRKGQAWLTETAFGTPYAACPRLWHGYMFAHIGQKLYAFDTRLGNCVTLYNPCPAVRGTFFAYNEKLYYKTRGAYIEITANWNGYYYTFTAADVTPYVPVITINASPYNGAGDMYQPENRICPRKTVWYNAVQGVTDYYLPVAATSISKVEVNGATLTTGWYYNPNTGCVVFAAAPAVTNPPTNNTVRITYYLANTDAYNSVMSCRFAEVYGGTGALCIVLGGSNVQTNAYFWNGQDSLAMNPGYFPMEQYQLAGDSGDAVTGFGKQQNSLIVFKEYSVGKTAIDTAEINNRLYVDMPYTPINSKTGCTLPWSIQLIENNLVWAGTGGIYMLQSTSAALENNIVCISRKINLQLAEDIAAANADEVCSADDDTRYYITANGNTWAWDYELSEYRNPSWFLLTNIDAKAVTFEAGDFTFISSAGRLFKLQSAFSDFGNPIVRLYRFPHTNFGSADGRKNVNSVLITLGAENLTDTALTYFTDYEARRDTKDLQVVAAASYETDRTPGTRPQSSSLPAVFRRRPMCRRILHFGMTLYNGNLNEDLAIISACIFFNVQGRLR